MDEMYQLLDDLNLAQVRLEECDAKSFVWGLNNEAYLRTKAAVEERGRQIFSDESLSLDEIKDRVIAHLAEKVKTFLSQDIDSMIGSMGKLDEDTGTALICMENVINAKNDSNSDFYYSNLFRIDREFFKKFSVAEVAKFEALSSVLAGVNDNSTNKETTK